MRHRLSATARTRSGTVRPGNFVANNTYAMADGAGSNFLQAEFRNSRALLSDVAWHRAVRSGIRCVPEGQDVRPGLAVVVIFPLLPEGAGLALSGGRVANFLPNHPLGPSECAKQSLPGTPSTRPQSRDTSAPPSIRLPGFPSRHWDCLGREENLPGGMTPQSVASVQPLGNVSH